MQQKIIIAGGTGFIGQYLSEKFKKAGAEVYIISRHDNHLNWSDEKGLISALNKADLVINLAGKSVDFRYNDANKKAILNSRIDTTKAIGNAILKCEKPPLLWINSSTATIYRHAEDRPMTEQGGELGTGFSVSVGKAWEEAFFSFHLPGTRQVALRIAIVLGKSGGAFIPYRNLTRFGLGGKQGSGKQMFSWIHIEDLYRIILFLQKHKDANGIFNASAPNPITNKAFMNTLQTQMHKAIALPAPKIMLELGAFLLGTETELLLKSRWVVPERLLESGYKFRYSDIEMAVKDLLS